MIKPLATIHVAKEVDLYGKIALPMASLVFGIVGAALGLNTQRGGGKASASAWRFLLFFSTGFFTIPCSWSAKGAACHPCWRRSWQILSWGSQDIFSCAAPQNKGVRVLGVWCRALDFPTPDTRRPTPTMWTLTRDNFTRDSGRLPLLLRRPAGTPLGKKRVSLFGLRPKHTAILITSITGSVISLLSVITVLVAFPPIRDVILTGERAIRDNRRLLAELKEKNPPVRHQLKDQKMATALIPGTKRTPRRAI